MNIPATPDNMTAPPSAAPPPPMQQGSDDATQINWAPVGPLDKAQKTQPLEPISFNDFVNAIRNEMRQERDSAEWRKRYLASQRNELFYRGFQRLRAAEMTNTWRILEPKPIHFTLNEFAFWCNVNVAKWCNSRADYRISGIDDVPDKDAAAQKLLQIARHYDDRDWKRTQVSLAAKQSMFEAHLVAYIYHDPTFENRKAYRPVTERVTLKLGNDVYRCADCDAVGEMDQHDQMAKMCDQCGGPNLAVTEVPEMEMEQVTGQKEIECGDVTHELISIYNLVWKARMGLAKSDVVLWEAEYIRSELEATYPGIDLPQSMGSGTGIQAKAALQNAGQGRQSPYSSAPYLLTRMWIEPNRYATKSLKDTLKHRTGEFPAGTAFSEAFPKGLHVIMVGELIVDCYPAVKNDDLVAMEYQSTPNGLARGVDDMCEPQRQMNTVNSLANLWMRHNAAPPMTYVAGVVDPGDLSGDLTRPIPIDAQNIGLYEGVTVENAITYKQGQVLQPSIFEYGEKLRQAIQFAAMATDFADGLPAVNNSTLGGAQIAQSLAQSISGVVLSQFGDFRAEIIKRKLKKFKKYCWDERYVQFSGQYGTLEGQTLSAMDIPDDFEIEVVPGSWLPRSTAIQQQNLQSMLAAAGGWQGLLAMPSEMFADMCEKYDVRIGANNYPAALRTCRARLQQSAMNVPLLQQAQTQMQAAGMPPPSTVQPDPMTGAPIQVPVTPGQQLMQMLQPPFNPREDGHEIAAEYLSKWFTTDEGLQAPPELIDFAGVLQDAHLQGAALHAQAKMQLAMAAQPPMPMGSAPGQKGQPSPPKQTGSAVHPVGG